MNTLRLRLLLVSVLPWLVVASVRCATPDPAMRPLMDRLIRDGMDSTRMAAIFQDERLQFLPHLIPLNALEREVPDVYSKFLKSSQVRDGYDYLRENRDLICSTLTGTGISPYVAVAVLKIESDLGRKPGKNAIFSSLATITMMADSLQWLADYDTSGGANLEAMEKRALRRSNWAYKELRYFLEVCDREGWDPLDIKGSWAGAFGWAQFLPSSFLRSARDGDGDGKVNPFTLPDALASIACFLKDAGWRSTPKSQRRALMQYNPSTAYVDCVLEYARKLKSMEGKPSMPAEEVGFEK